MADLVIRGGTIVDGSGGAPFEADVAISNGRITAIGDIAESGTQEIDARGKLVTPGFIDVHTHYDAQATWGSHITPSSWNGVTTALIGNCGVGFAPCRPDERDMLVKLMEGVEDIPEVVLTPAFRGTGKLSRNSSTRLANGASTWMWRRKCRTRPCASM
jgi:N-acyl-D-aspartate/D-glutamate deacylase